MYVYVGNWNWVLLYQYIIYQLKADPPDYFHPDSLTQKQYGTLVQIEKTNIVISST